MLQMDDAVVLAMSLTCMDAPTRAALAFERWKYKHYYYIYSSSRRESKDIVVVARYVQKKDDFSLKKKIQIDENHVKSAVLIILTMWAVQKTQVLYMTLFLEIWDLSLKSKKLVKG